jgi:hypothetical protein
MFVASEVTRPDVRDHTGNRLMLDRERMVDGDEERTWWPHATLAGWRMHPRDMRVAIWNAAAHVETSAQVIGHGIVGFPLPRQDGHTRRAATWTTR